MSKNSPKQNIQALKEWLEFMNFKSKPKPIKNAHNSVGDFMKHSK
jgi:hypothetical protein